MKCPGCGTEIPSGKNCCPMCGATMEKIRADLGEKYPGAKPVISEPPSRNKDEERTIWEGNPEWKAYMAWILFAVLTLPSIIIPIIVFIFIILERSSCNYKVTSKRVICKFGILSRRSYELEINDIRSTNVSQSFFQRILGVGNIEFATAAGPIKEAVILKISAPESLKERIRSLKQ